MTERQLHIPVGDGHVFGVLYEPEAQASATLVCCEPLFEERKAAQRVFVELARACCQAGIAVLRYDYRGCGDSPGAFEEFRLTDAAADLTHLVAICRQHLPGRPVRVIAARGGALVLLRALSQGLAIDGAVLWEPVVDGAAYIHQELRRKLMKEMMTFGASQTTRDDLVKQLEAGNTIDVDGYALTGSLYHDFQQACAPRLRNELPENLRVVGISASGAASPGVQALNALIPEADAAEQVALRRGQPFWSLVGYVDCTEVIDETVTWLCAGHGSAHVSEPPEGMPVPVVEVAEESPVSFTSGDDLVCGILHRPQEVNPGMGIVFCHGWSGSRLGPHRMFVKMARRLSPIGCHCLRVDFRGRGNSGQATQDASIAGMVADVNAATEYLRRTCGVERILLLGICSGGKVAAAAAARQPGIEGLVLWSAEALGSLRATTTNRRKTMHAVRSYVRKLTRPETWRKIVTGKVNLKAVNKAVFEHETRSDAEARDEQNALDLFRAYAGDILFVYGANDPDTELAGRNYQTFCDQAGIRSEFHAIAGANHSFYSLVWEQQVMDLTESWLQQRMGAA